MIQVCEICANFLFQAWNSDEDDGSYLDPAMRKKAVKIKHVKRREKRSEKKVIPVELLPWNSYFLIYGYN